jgi:hypothetical protein
MKSYLIDNRSLLSAELGSAIQTAVHVTILTIKSIRVAEVHLLAKVALDS